ncbi:hypothetical protein GCM10023221_30620 [Luteimicrobium xylanilyticum]|uniref:hypothetical protein n=1 Tax=Luteimicrobium xylanilyticum TaxID=1133546 RepID=UPI0004B24297|nr:hypothetical protein [Luteimicrobium xylanilyticum]
MFSAWGDESGSVSSVDPGTYLMAAVVVEPPAVEELRDAMRPLLLPGQKKAHWRGDSDTRHDVVSAVVADLPLDAVVVVRCGPDRDRDERRRRKCFEVLAPLLADLGCTELTLESRGVRDDRRDRDMLDALRASRRLGPSMRLKHAPGPADPVLWIADAVCGAVVADRVGRGRWLRALERRTTIHVVDERPKV